MKHLAALGLALTTLMAQSSDPAKPRPSQAPVGALHRIQGSVSPVLEGMRLSFTKQVQDDDVDIRVDVDRGRFSATLAPGSYSVRAIAKDRAFPGIPLIVSQDMPNVALAFRPEVSKAPAEVQAWIRNNAIPLRSVVAGSGFTDLQPLKALVGKATVVGLGEATHGTKEFFQLKHRMLEFLVEEMGFRVFAIEANLPEAYAVDEYIRTGQGDPAKVLYGLQFWTWDTREVLDMILWMRAYNADPQHTRKLRFYGVDMQYHRTALTQAEAWLKEILPEEAQQLDGIAERIAARQEQGESRTGSFVQGFAVAAGFNKPPSRDWLAIAKDLDALILCLETRKAALSAAGNGERFARGCQHLRVLSQFARLEADPKQTFRVRDEAMAANLRWIQEMEPGAKIVLWAHNAHVSATSRVSTGAPSMGWHLRQTLGEAYLPIGFAFREGGFQAQNADLVERGLKVFDATPPEEASLDAALAASGHSALALDLRALPPGPLRDWFMAPQGTLDCGAVFRVPADPRIYVPRLAPSARFGALLFVNRTSAAEPLPLNVATQPPANLDFEVGEPGQALIGWRVGGGPGYAAQVVAEDAKTGSRCLKIAYKGDPKARRPFSAAQHLDAGPFRGRKLRLSAWVRAKGSSAYRAGLRAQVSRERGRSLVVDTTGRQTVGSAWTQVVAEFPVAADATILSISCFVQGVEVAWFDGVQIEAMP